MMFTFWNEERLLFNFAFSNGQYNPSASFVLALMAFQIILEIVVALIVTVAEERQDNQIVESWQPGNRKKTIVVYLTIYFEMLLLFIYYAASLPNLLFCAAWDSCTCYPGFMTHDIFCNYDS